MGAVATAAFAARIAARSQEVPPRALAGLSALIWGDFGLIASFTVFLIVAIAFRTRVEVHKRLMVLASISLIAPALARLSRWPVFGGEPGPFIPLALLILLALLPAYDVIARRRLHAATLIGTVSLLLVTFGARTFGVSEAGRALLQVFA
jgi:hypothetical protein